MKNKIYIITSVLTILVYCLILVNKYADFNLFIDSFSFEEKKVNNGYKSINLYQNEIEEANNLSTRNKKIEYIVIHYAGTTSDAESMINSLNRGTTTDSSADFFISLNGKIYQYNINLNDKYSWAVGGEKIKNTTGGAYYEKVTNENSVSIEMTTYYENNEWLFTDETINSTIELVRYLINKYNIPENNIIRHYDVTGKLCPNIDGWVDNNETKWNKFKNDFN